MISNLNKYNNNIDNNIDNDNINIKSQYVKQEYQTIEDKNATSTSTAKNENSLITYKENDINYNEIVLFLNEPNEIRLISSSSLNEHENNIIQNPFNDFSFATMTPVDLRSENFSELEFNDVSNYFNSNDFDWQLI